MSALQPAGKKILTAAFERLYHKHVTAPRLTIRNAPGNSTVFISGDGVNECGCLKVSEGRTFEGIDPYLLWVKGTAGQVLFWDVEA